MPRRLPGDLTSDVDDLTVWALWMLEDRAGRVTRAQIRRGLLARACADARRRNPAVAQLVQASLESRQARAAQAAARADPVVTPMFGRPRRATR